MFSFLTHKPKPKPDDFCKPHNQPVDRVCVKRNCIHPRFICNIPECAEPHSGHATSSYSQYTDKMGLLKQEIGHRQLMADIVEDYYSKAQKDIHKWAETEKVAFLN